jgi:hypothetical protein
MLKNISLAALAATFITGSAALAHAEGDAGLNEAAAAWTTSAALESGAHEGAFAPWRGPAYAYAPFAPFAYAPYAYAPYDGYGYGSGSYGYSSYGYAGEPMRIHSSKKPIRHAQMTRKSR